MYIRSVFITFSIWLLFLPSVFAQKRVHARVNPNADTFNVGADLYVPQSGEFVSTTGNMVVAREEHTAITLNDGRVLIAGGRDNRYLKSAEIFDPSTGLFEPNYQTITNPITGLSTTTVGDMNSARSGAEGVLLLDDRVLIAGGYNGGYLKSAELYDPETGVFDSARNMQETRYRPSMTLLSDGRVLLTGGFNSTFLSSAEIYNPFSNLFTFTSSMITARKGHTATLLSDGKVLIAGGCANAESNRMVCDEYLSSAEIYDPVEGIFEETGELNEARAEHTASLLPDGRVLIVGGTDGNTPLATAEIYDPATGTFTYSGNMGTSRMAHTATVMLDGRVLLAGGYSGSYLNSAEVFTPSSGTFSPVASSMSTQRLRHAATVLPDGRILFTGGLNSDLLVFDVNTQVPSDNVSPNIVYTSDSQVGFVPYTGSGAVVAFSPSTGEVLERIVTGGEPAFITPLPDDNTLAVVSVFDNRIFLIEMDTLSLKETFIFTDAQFGFGSILTLSPDGSRGYISSTGTGEVIQFDTATGNELKRLDGLDAPAQITVTPDGRTLLVVDTGTTELYVADTSSMNTKFKITPRTVFSLAAFSIFNKPVLSPDGQDGIIGSRDINETGDAATNTIYRFNTSTGEITHIGSVGPRPGYTTLTPDGVNWMVLSSDSVAIIPVDDSESTIHVETTQGIPNGSSNIVFSQDGRYAFYAASTSDRILQQDLETNGIVGSYQVGDIPDISFDQPSGIAITPDDRTIAVLNTVSNEVDLLVDATMLRVPEFINDRDQFTGITLINLSDSYANLTLTALNTTGGNIFQLSDGTSDQVSPVILPPLAPNAQFSMDLSQIFNLNDNVLSLGHLEISSDQSAVVGFAVAGKIRATYLESQLAGMEGISLYRFPERLYDWIAPDVPEEENIPSLFVFTNPNYNSADYQIIRYGKDGSLLEANIGDETGPSSMDSLEKTDLFTDSLVSQVLITGGRNVISSSWTETYNPDDKVFSGTGSMAEPRHGHAAALLKDGNVLVSGGRNGLQVLKTAEVYSPIFRQFFPIVGTMIHDRYRHTATVLNDGKVLVAGGQNSVSINGTAELYDPESNTFSATVGFMNSARDSHTATLLPDGRVLLAGGIDGIGLSSTAEIYDPATSTFNMTGIMNTGRAFHKAVLLPSGKVLITGGYNGEYLSSAELYDPAAGTFTEIPSMNVARANHTATLLQDGTVLITGGRDASGVLDSAEIFYPQANQFILLPRSLTEPRSQHTATLLPDGTVLLVSGTDGTDVLYNSDIYNPESRTFSLQEASQTAQREHTATLLAELIAGYLRGVSVKGLMFREHRGAIAARIGINGIEVDQFAGVTRIYSPMFVTLENDRTVLSLINANQDYDATVTITLYDSNGNILGTPVIQELPSNYQLNDDLVNIFQNDPEVIGQEGWIEVSSTVDQVVGSISFGQAGGNIQTVFALSGTPVDDFLVPLAAENSDYRTDISLLNASDQPAEVRIELWGAAGGTNPEQVRNITLLPNNRVEGFLSDYFPGESDRLYGYIRVISDQSLYSYSILWDSDFEFGCSMPPIPVPVQ
jgi:sugar lactone lactonase YvrE